MNTGYRAFPEYFTHPRLNKQLTEDEFKSLQTSLMQVADSLCPSHIQTKVHYVASGEHRGYIVEVILVSGVFFIETPCTFTPTMGMDGVDGNLAQDAENWIIAEDLGQTSARVRSIFGSNDRIRSSEYLKLFGFPFHLIADSTSQSSSTTDIPIDQDDVKKKPWWKRW
ncbi:MAG: hypothetical protein JSS89_01360 [Bacteroidetes bacterium]|nr:hypothetical protein [Bacteroidota bacterium]